MSDQERLNNLFATQNYMVIAVTLEDGTPWAVPVKLQHRDGYTFEWDSKLDTVHSRALLANPRMSVTIFDKRENTQTGVYAKGIGELLSSDGDIGKYRFTSEAAWLNDETFRKREVTLG